MFNLDLQPPCRPPAVNTFSRLSSPHRPYRTIAPRERLLTHDIPIPRDIYPSPWSMAHGKAAAASSGFSRARRELLEMQRSVHRSSLRHVELFAGRAFWSVETGRVHCRSCFPGMASSPICSHAARQAEHIRQRQNGRPCMCTSNVSLRLAPSSVSGSCRLHLTSPQLSSELLPSR